MALLSLADHSILSSGTFGMWGAFLANRLQTGETVLSSDVININPQRKMMLALDKYNITNWTVL